MARILGPDDGEAVDLGGLGVRFMIGADAAAGGFSLVEHPIAPRTLAAPLHRHANEDEYSYVLEGRVGVQLGDEPARLLEIISPGGFEQYFADIAPLLPPSRLEPDFAALAAVQARYGLEMDIDSIGPLIERHGLRA